MLLLDPINVTALGGLSLKIGGQVLTANYRYLAERPPADASAVRTAAQVGLYSRLVSPGGPADIDKVSARAGVGTPAIYGQTSGRSPVTLPVVVGLAEAGDPEGACELLAVALFALAARPAARGALLDLVREVAAYLGQDVVPAQSVATDEELIEALSACGENAGDQVQRIIRILRDRRVSEEERVELRTMLPLWIRALQAARALVEQPSAQVLELRRA